MACHSSLEWESGRHLGLNLGPVVQLRVVERFDVSEEWVQKPVVLILIVKRLVPLDVVGFLEPLLDLLHLGHLPMHEKRKLVAYLPRHLDVDVDCSAAVWLALLALLLKLSQPVAEQ